MSTAGKMGPTVAMTTTSDAGRRPALRRDPGRRVVGGVCAGIARRTGLDPLIVRVAFVVLAAAGGLGVILYLAAWIVVPSDTESSTADAVPVRIRTGRGAIEVALGVALLLIGILLTLRATGIWFSDAIVWPFVLLASGGALIWRQSTGGRDPAIGPEVTADLAADPEDPAVSRVRAVSRTGLGVALVLAAGLVFLEASGALGAARDVLLALLVTIVVLGVIFAPWVLGLVRSRDAERAERIRTQERAELAAHLHDSVLQTLALMQKRADDPREVATLARRQERELRSWLSARPEPVDGERRLIASLEQAAGDVEAAHGIPVEVIGVGDATLDDRGEAVVAAAREAMVNAAKFSGDAAVAVYAEVDAAGRLEVFVRDRGVGFDPTAVGPDRQGLRESITGRMERHGGRAHVRSAPGAGTEIELVLEPE